MRSNNPSIWPGSNLTLQMSGPNGQRMESIGELESAIIGSGPEARIQIEDSAVSSLHLLIKRDREGTVRAIDLGSEAGTLLWDVPLPGAAALTSGDGPPVG